MKKLIAWLLALLLLTTAALAEETTMVVVGRKVHLRESTSRESASRGLYFVGTPVSCTGPEDDGWTPVRIGGEQGYMMTSCLTDDLGTISHLTWRQRATVRTDSFVNLRELPDGDSRVITQLHEGDRVTVLGETAWRWCLVDVGGLQGYMVSGFLELDDSEAPSDASCTFITPDVLAVLRGETSFWHLQERESLRLEDISPRRMNGQSVAFPRYAVSDVDRDGSMELVLVLSVEGNEDYGYLVLKSTGSGVIGSEVPFRGMLSPRADGTCVFSNGADDTGFGYLCFADMIMVFHNVGSYEGDMITPCRIEGYPVPVAAWQAAQRAQDRKPGVIWREFTPAALEELGRIVGQ